MPHLQIQAGPPDFVGEGIRLSQRRHLMQGSVFGQACEHPHTQQDLDIAPRPHHRPEDIAEENESERSPEPNDEPPG